MKNLSKIAFAAIIALSATGLSAEMQTAEGLSFKGTSHVKQHLTTFHFKDGSHVVMPGAYEHFGDTLKKDIKEKADKFLEKRNKKQKENAAKKMAGKKASDIVGATHTKLMSNTIITDVKGHKQMSIIPVGATHKHGGNEQHEKKVTSLFNLNAGLSNVMNDIPDIIGAGVAGAGIGGAITGVVGTVGGTALGGVGEFITGPLGAVAGGAVGAAIGAVGAIAGKFISGAMG